TPSPTAAPVPPSAEPDPTVPPAEVSVPTLHGSLADAEAALRAAGLALGTVTRVESAEAADRVLSQQPAEGVLPPGGAVNVTVASGTNVLPQASGLTLGAASALLSSAGFDVVGDRPDAAASTLVVRSEPGAGAVLRLGVRVTLILSGATPTPTGTATPPASGGDGS
ncbi:PASTA domain-containing protein, partial [Microbacterium sp. CPCC 204701]|uniref:PASTA domain-containing protein n=1 Tax=Microbacterium sp. CPCC 204701 TaxID=2493084 RepID=UPI000FD82C4D